MRSGISQYQMWDQSSLVFGTALGTGFRRLKRTKLSGEG